jgi:malate dehydrogenase
MVPLTRMATRNSIPVSKFISEERLDEVMEATKVGGGKQACNQTNPKY